MIDKIRVNQMSQQGTDFERLVADFCIRHWGHDNVQINRFIDGKEHDVVISTKSELVFIECTIDKSKKKAVDDIIKIRDARRTLAGDAPQRPVRGYFVLPTEPSPDVHQVALDNGIWIEATSFAGLINKFNCSSTYLIERKKRAFGSVRNPLDDTIALGREKYVQVPLKTSASRDNLTLDALINEIVAGERTRVIVTGDFGVGKSMLFRETFFRLAEKFNAGEIFRFPIYINLDDTSFDEGDDVVDLIERHAKWVGLRAERDRLIHAWSTDCCILILDGFDELIRAGFTRLTTSSRDIRFASSHIIRKVVTDSPIKTPIFISGRQSYFPNEIEMRECLSARDFSLISLHDLDEKEVKQLYRKILPKSKDPILMGWLPQRALLLSYIYFELGENLSEDAEFVNPLSPGDGWNMLLDRLSRRETNVAKGAEPTQIRRLVERVALFSRTNISDVGRVTSLHVAQAYRDVMKMEPDISVQQVLMRLPGLTSGRANEERSFIDSAYFEAAQAGTIVEAVEALGSRSDGYLRSQDIERLLTPLRRTDYGISTLTAQVVVSRLKGKGTLGLLGVAINEASVRQVSLGGNLLADLLVCAMTDPNTCIQKDTRDLTISGAFIKEMEINSEILAKTRLRFKDCIFDTMIINADVSILENLTFVGCEISTMECSREVSRAMPMIGLDRTRIAKEILLDATNADIMELAIPDHFKVLKIVLRKMFMQAGSGRKKAALYRGMYGIEPSLIDECLSIILRNKIAYVIGNSTSDESVWHPNRSHMKRATFLIETLTVPDDKLLNDFKRSAERL